MCHHVRLLLGVLSSPEQDWLRKLPAAEGSFLGMASRGEGAAGTRCAGMKNKCTAGEVRAAAAMTGEFALPQGGRHNWHHTTDQVTQKKSSAILLLTLPLRTVPSCWCRAIHRGPGVKFTFFPVPADAAALSGPAGTASVHAGLSFGHDEQLAPRWCKALAPPASHGSPAGCCEPRSCQVDAWCPG